MLIKFAFKKHFSDLVVIETSNFMFIHVNAYELMLSMNNRTTLLWVRIDCFRNLLTSHEKHGITNVTQDLGACGHKKA